MIAMRRLALVSLLASLSLPFALAAVAPAAAAMDDDDEFVGDEAYVKLKLTHDGKTKTHPGYLALTGEEMILSMGKGDAAQEVSILLERGEDQSWSATVAYKVGGAEVLSGTQTIRTKAWVAFKSADGKSKVELHVDPDSKGGDDIDLGKGNKPLDGLK